MKQEPKITSVTKYREKFITEHIDGTFTVSNFQYPTFEKRYSPLNVKPNEPTRRTI